MNKNIYSWHENLWQELISRKLGFPHALLLHGQAGTGKRDFAEMLAHAMLCESPAENGLPCGCCAACAWLAAGTHPDFHILQPASEAALESAQHDDVEDEKPRGEKEKKVKYLIVVDQVRALIESITLSAGRGGMRVILVHPAEALNPNAANALLKTLEEPAPNTLFILVSHQLQRLLPTVRSRCLKIAMPMPSVSAALAWLAKHGVNDGEALLAQAGGTPLRALELADGGYREKRIAFLSSLQENTDPLALSEAGEKLELAWVLNWLQTWVYDLICAHATKKVRYHPDFEENLVILSKAIDVQKLFEFQRDLLGAQRSLHHPLNPRLVLEQLLLTFWQIMKRAQERPHVR